MYNQLSIDQSAAAEFRDRFSQSGTAGDLGPAMSCTEADAMAGMLAGLAEVDEEGDEHYRQTSGGYVVPVDPMDEVQCDSCQ